ncbi:MAG: NAD-dependent epimerase/dehydratase family protein [Sulfobacillus sp.]
MRVVVTGGAGFIGSHLVDRLLARGDLVTVVDDLSTGKRENVPASVSLIEAEVADLDAIGPAFTGADLVFHLAAVASVPRSIAQPLAVHRANGQGVLSVLEACRAAAVARVIVVSSAAVYGNSAGVQQEDACPKPESFYGIDKLAGEMYLQAYHRLFGMAGLAIRPFNVYGPRQALDAVYGSVIPRFVARLKAGLPVQIEGTGEATRDFTYVADLVDGLIRAAGADLAVMNGQPVNLAVGHAISVLTLATELAAAAGVDLKPLHGPARVGDILHSQADISRAKALFGYAPQVSLKEGLALTYRALAQA